ncbi:MAG: carbohydrate kinase [Prevotella sp.]|jgi:fructokinase|nr:carbohydrate kinase [Prevotella sp.]
MRRVFGIGETVLDIIFKNEQPIGAVPGGSVFNAVISIGRTGIPAAFISETGNDRVGQRIISFLQENGVDASSVNIYADSKSPLSLAFLNEQNDAEYIFYKDHPHDRLDFDYPDVQPDDVVLFGSYYAVNPVIRPQVAGFLEFARQRGAILYYDVNFRASHKNEVMKLTPNLIENLEVADIVRGSSEDFEVLYRKTDADTVYRSEISFYTKKFIYTRGSQPVELRADGGLAKQYPVKPGTEPVVSTIGAGDNFNAGFVYGLIKYGVTRKDIEQGISEELWDKLIESAQLFSANVCASLNNSVSPEFGAEMKKALNN